MKVSFDVKDFLIWFARCIIGAVFVLIGLGILGVDLLKFPLWMSFSALICFSIGYTIMPPLPSKAEGTGSWKKKQDWQG